MIQEMARVKATIWVVVARARNLLLFAVQELPSLVTPLIYERDQYLAFNLRRTCQKVIPAHKDKYPVCI